MDFFALFRRAKKNRKSGKPSAALLQQHTAKPGFEPLEDRMLLSANVISGYVYHDANNNGIFDAGETPIANAKLELHNSQGQLVSSTTSDANGYYQFVRDDTVNTTPLTVTQTVTIPETSAGFDITKQVNQFDPNLGQLLEVDIVQNGAITSDIKAENSSTLTGATITGTVSGSISLNGAGINLTSTVSNNAGSFKATAFDGTIDFAGGSGKDFGPITATADTKSITLTGAQMSAFIGNGQLNFDEIAEVNSTATGGGNLTANIASTADATFTVTYKYKPGNPLQPGNYTIVETEQPFIPGTQTRYFDGKDAAVGVPIPNSIGTDIIPVVLNGQDVPNNNFGELAPVTLSGNVYFDANNNGTLDPGETGIGGTTINLSGTDYLGQSVKLNATTAADGTYGFINLRPGTYTLSEVQPAGYLDGKDHLGTLSGTLSNDQFSNIVAGSGVNGSSYDFGELKSAGIAGFVYNDVNNNGIKDAGENGIGGVTVTLTGADDQGPVSVTTTTAADGSYGFTNLRRGTYTITETQPAAWLDGKDTLGTPGGTVSNDQFSNIVLGDGVQGVNNNFGELQPANLSGFVWNDANNDGVMQPGENGIGGATVTLTGTDDLGHTVTQSMFTAADGSYAFANMRPGMYAIQETQPTGWLDGKDAVGSQGGQLSNDRINSIAVSQGLNGTNNNFGELLPGSLSGFVWNDTNNDGLMQQGEAGIAGASLTLTGTDDLGQAVTRTTTSAADGSYKFDSMRPGSYAVSETQPTGWMDGKDAVGTQGGQLSNDRISGIPMGQGVNGINNNFGELQPGDISGFVYADNNNDGIKQSGEQGIAGVNLTLTGTDDLGQAVTRTTTTAADGSYKFDNLRPGNYAVQETQPAGYQDGKDAVGSLGGTLGNDVLSNIAVGQNQHGTNYNFGEINPAGLSGFVYHDLNDNGIKDAGEEGIGGVTLTLTSNGTVVTQTTTAADGSYSFQGILAGNYTIQEAQPSGWLDGKDAAGSAGGFVSNDAISNIGLAAGASGNNYNFGELKPGSLSGKVWQDDNNNGVIDAGETGLGGVTVKLSGTDDTGALVTQQTTTAADGSYNFTNLRPGAYNLDEVQPTGYLDGKDSLGTLGGTLSNDHFGNIGVGDSQNGVQYNFGERIAADVYIDKQVTPTSTLPGTTLTYTLTVGNKGPSDAQNIQVIDPLPAGETFISAAAQGWIVTQSGSNLIFTRDSLAVGASSVITITAAAPLIAGTYPNTATVTTTTFDVDLTNNHDDATVTVTTTPTLEEPPPQGPCVVQIFSSSNWLALLQRNA